MTILVPGSGFTTRYGYVDTGSSRAAVESLASFRGPRPTAQGQSEAHTALRTESAQRYREALRGVADGGLLGLIADAASVRADQEVALGRDGSTYRQIAQEARFEANERRQSVRPGTFAELVTALVQCETVDEIEHLQGGQGWSPEHDAVARIRLAQLTEGVST